MYYLCIFFSRVQLQITVFVTQRHTVNWVYVDYCIYNTIGIVHSRKCSYDWSNDNGYDFGNNSPDSGCVNPSPPNVDDSVVLMIEAQGLLASYVALSNRKSFSKQKLF